MSFSLGGFGLTMPVDWAVNRVRIMGRTAMPPAHLLRQVFDTAPDYASARRILAETPLCIPAIFTLTGAGPSEGCVIERREADGFIHDGPVACANHWQAPGFRGRARPIRSRDRLAAMRAAMPAARGDFDWLTPPILNAHTRLAAELDAGSGRLRVQGWHGDRPVTEPLALDRLSAG